jgi:hypothetical protein
MKKVSMGLVHFVFMLVIVLFLIASLSSCNIQGNVDLNANGIISDRLKSLKMPISISAKVDTAKIEVGINDTTTNNELKDDFRYDNMFK